jgi:hypothetical protein
MPVFSLEEILAVARAQPDSMTVMVMTRSDTQRIAWHKATTRAGHSDQYSPTDEPDLMSAQINRDNTMEETEATATAGSGQIAVRETLPQHHLNGEEYMLLLIGFFMRTTAS